MRRAGALAVAPACPDDKNLLGGVILAGLLSDLSTVVTSIFGWIATTATTITETPLLLLTTGFLVLGGTVGIFGRLLSRS